MKKVLLSFVLGIAIIALLFSCKKEQYHCICSLIAPSGYAKLDEAYVNNPDECDAQTEIYAQRLPNDSIKCKIVNP